MEIFIRGAAALGIALAVAAITWAQPPQPAAPPAAVQPHYVQGHAAAQDNGTGWSPFMESYFQRRDARGNCGCLGKTNRGVQFNIQRLHSKKEGFGGGPQTQPGTLVFPQHPFARSPRDFFMID
jgi:hypothetical protein